MPKFSNIGITAVSVGGFKSYNKTQEIEIKPITVLSGANSAGKSSIMQPLLMLKQTLDSQYDPGLLLINGANVKFSSIENFLNRNRKDNLFNFGIKINSKLYIELYFQGNLAKKKIEFIKMIYKKSKKISEIKIDSPEDELIKILGVNFKRFYDSILDDIDDERGSVYLGVIMDRFLPSIQLVNDDGTLRSSNFFSDPQVFKNEIQNIIHITGLRGIPERIYGTTYYGNNFPGLFQFYVASIIKNLQESQKRKDKNKLLGIKSDLKYLGLTWNIKAKLINDTSVELKVGRLPTSKKRDMVNIADVGFGVSQVLPIIVALNIAEPNQIVYIEQPEIHLHPNAERKMSVLFANAIKRGIKIVIETHSRLILKGIQIEVVKKNVPSDDVALYWFSRNLNTGDTKISKGKLDSDGAYGNWPEDFDKVLMSTDLEFLNS